MNQLLINTDGLISGLVDRYHIWKDHKNFYNNTSDPYLIDHSDVGIPCFHYMDIKEINNSNSPIVAIDCLTEGIHGKQKFEKYRTDCHYIIFSNGWWDPQQYNLPISYTLVWHLFFLFEMCDTYNSPNRFCYYLDKDYKFDYPKPCVFVSTTGNVRTERNTIVNLVKQKLSYDNFIFKYSGQDVGLKSTDFDVIQFNIGEFDPYTDILEKYYHNVSQSLPIDLYNQGYFNLVVETDLSWNNSFFLTEKVIKCLISGQPFVVCAQAEYLKHLRELGFCTYDSIWDESYDSIENFDQRMHAVVDLVEQLKFLNWDKHRDQLIEIQLHNQRLFNRLTSISNQEFTNLEKLIKDL